MATLKTQIDHLKQSLAAAESKLKRSDQAKANEAYNTKNELQQLRKQIRTLTAEKANLMATARAKSNLDGPAPPRIQVRSSPTISADLVKSGPSSQI